MLFHWDSSREDADRVIADYWGGLANDDGIPELGEDGFAEQLFRGAVAYADSADELIRTHAANWKLERIAAVDRNLLRLAIYELHKEPTADAVVIDEALEVGRRFAGEESIKFLNGVLDAVHRAGAPA